MGWIKIDRAIQDHWIAEEKPYNHLSAWIDLLMLAAYKDTKINYKGNLISVKRGQCLVTLRGLASRWGWSKDRVSRFLALLECDKMCDINRDSGRTLVTIENYEFYQDGCDSNKDTDKTLTRTQTRQSRDSDETQKKEVKKLRKKEEYIYIGFGGQALQDAFESFVEMRKKIKSPMSDNAIVRCINRLKKLSGEDEQLAIKILNQSEDNCWKDIYPLKDHPQNLAKNPSCDDEQDKLRKQLLDEYRHLCDVIPGCKDHNNKTMQSRFWQLVKTDDINKSIRKAQKLSVWVSQELQTRDMTLGGLFDELSSRNSSDKQSAD